MILPWDVAREPREGGEERRGEHEHELVERAECASCSAGSGSGDGGGGAREMTGRRRD
jgi:hypothetical protein